MNSLRKECKIKDTNISVHLQSADASKSLSAAVAVALQFLSDNTQKL